MKLNLMFTVLLFALMICMGLFMANIILFAGKTWINNKKTRIIFYSLSLVITIAFTSYMGIAIFEGAKNYDQSYTYQEHSRQENIKKETEEKYRPQIEELKEKRKQYDKNSEDYANLTDEIINKYHRWAFEHHNCGALCGSVNIRNATRVGPIYAYAQEFLDQDIQNNVPGVKERKERFLRHYNSYDYELNEGE